MDDDKSCYNVSCGSFWEKLLYELHVELGETYDTNECEQHYRHGFGEVIPRYEVIRQEYQHNGSYAVIAVIVALIVNVIPAV